MSSLATVTTERLRIDGVDVERITVDCPHGTTTGDLVNGHLPGAPDHDAMARILASRHETEERCGCALPLIQDGARA